jgi:prolyl-tRNA synthetase
VCLVSLARSPEGVEAAERLYGELVGAGLEVLYDDREDASAGVKLKDADLRGIPIRVVIGERSLKRGGAELKGRADDEVRIVPLGDLIAEVRAEIDALEGELILG